MLKKLNPEGGKRKRYRSLPVSNLILDTKLSKKEFNRMIDSVVDLSESIGKDRIKREIQNQKTKDSLLVLRSGNSGYGELNPLRNWTMCLSA